MDYQLQTRGDQTFIYAKKAPLKTKDTRKQLPPDASTSEVKNEETRNLADCKQSVLDRAKEKKAKKSKRKADEDNTVPEEKKKMKPMPTPRIRLLQAPKSKTPALRVRDSVARSQQTSARGWNSARRTCEKEIQATELDIILADDELAATNAGLNAEESEVPEEPLPRSKVFDNPFKDWAWLLFQLGQKNLPHLLTFMAMTCIAFFAGKYLGEKELPKPPDGILNFIKMFFWSG